MPWTSADTAPLRARSTTPRGVRGRPRRDSHRRRPAVGPGRRPLARRGGGDRRRGGEHPAGPPARARRSRRSSRPHDDREIVRASQEESFADPSAGRRARRAPGLARARHRAEVAVGAPGEPLGGRADQRQNAPWDVTDAAAALDRADAHPRVRPRGLQHLLGRAARCAARREPGDRLLVHRGRRPLAAPRQARGDDRGVPAASSAESRRGARSTARRARRPARHRP